MNRTVYLSLIVALLVFPSTVLPQGNIQSRNGILTQGTNVRVRFPDNLDSDRNRNGDQFQATLDQDLISNGSLLARAGSTVFFRLVDVQAGGPSRNRSRVSLTLTGIQAESSVIPIETNTLTVATAPNRNQTLNFRVERSTTFDTGGDNSATTRQGVHGRISEIARELNSRTQHLLGMTRSEGTRTRARNVASDLYSAMGRFAN